MKWHAWMLALAITAISPQVTAQAGEMTIGHVAPGIGPVQLYINNEAIGPELVYGGFAQLPDVPAQFRAEIRSTIDGASLARGSFLIEPGEPVKPLLAFAGNGINQPLAIKFYQGDGQYRPTPDPRIDAAFGAHHLAPYETPDSPRWGNSVLQCKTSNTSVTGGWGGDAGSTQAYGSASINTFRLNGREGSCTLQIADPVFGSFTIVADLVARHTIRLLLIGDGVRAPFQALVVDDGAVVNVTQAATPTPGAVLFSESIWFDVARPAQAVTLYETAGADSISGFWVTHDTAGKPVWYFMDGVRTSLPGQRDIALHRFSADPDKPVSVDAGSARLFYIDCNQAELRILSGEREFHTLRLRRSRAVAACEVFD